MPRLSTVCRIAGILGVTAVAVAALVHGVNHDVAYIAIFVIGGLAGFVVSSRRR